MRRPFGKSRTSSDEPDEIRAPRIDGYDDLVVIGRGATSTVFRARQASHDRDVAIKVLNIDISDRRARRRFERERSVNGRLSHHPNVVTVLESGLVDGRQPYLAMELFEHGSLADGLARRGPLDVADALHHCIRVAGALESAHRLGVLHRDVKPHNILRSGFGEPALADFGIASLLEHEGASTAALTPNHAAPELLEGQEPTARSDVYSLASTMFTLLAGSPPFAGAENDGVLAQLLRITTGDVPPVPRNDMPDGLEALLHRSLARVPDDRPASAEEFGRALQRIQADMGLAVSALPLEGAGASSDANVAAERPSAALQAAPDDGDITIEKIAAWAGGVGDETIDVPAGREPGFAGTASFDGAPDVGDVNDTVHPGLDSPTVVGRAAYVRRQRSDEPSRRRWSMVIWIAAVIVTVVAVGVVARTLLRDDPETTASNESVMTSDTEQSNPEPETPSSSPAGSATAPTEAEIDALAPIGLIATPTGAGTLVTWDDQADGAFQFIVVATLDDGSEVAPDQPTPPGAETLTLDVDLDRIDCITVAAILGRLDDQLVRAESEPLCP